MRRRALLGLCALARGAWQPAAAAQPALAAEPGGGLEGDLAVHDPTLWVDARGDQWVFSTGQGIARLHSRDGRRWERLAPVFTVVNKPNWWALQVPAHRGLDVWAPKLFPHDGRLWVLYSISTFGKRTSAIGLASVSLAEGPGAADWRDDGVVLTSDEAGGGERFNAIDPDALRDSDGSLWMAWGSWWRGLYVTELDPARLRPRGAASPIARRAGGIEAPTLLRRGEHVYLFMSCGLCCKGVHSTYQVRMGRGPGPRGPFVDREGRPLLDGGGTLLLDGGPRWKGPGHQDAWTSPGGEDTLVWHAYDAEAEGQPRLRRSVLRWGADGWPSLA